MGASVREPKKLSPPRFILDTCPHCKSIHKVINGAWLRWKREKRGLDQRTLAKELGVSGPYISDIERNRRDCPDSIAELYRRL